MTSSLPTLRPPEHVASLDGLRGVFALCVAIYHFSAWTHVFGRGTPASSAVAVLGIYSVEGFFIISGFCFFHLYGRTGVAARDLRGFYMKRYLRLAPLYYLAFGLNVIFARPVGPMIWQRVLENLTLSFGLFHPNHARVLGGWSIGIEVVFYLAFPLLAWLLRSRAALLTATSALVLLAFLHDGGQGSTTSIWLRFDQYVQVPNHAFLFLLGGVVADLRRRVDVRLPSALSLTMLLVVGAVAAHFQPVFQDHFDVMHGLSRFRYLLACFAVVLVCAFGRPMVGLFSKPVRWLGDVSYSVYLLHPFASFAATSVLPPGASPITGFALGLLLTLAFAALGRRCIEEPAIALGKRLSRREGPPVAGSVKDGVER